MKGPLLAALSIVISAGSIIPAFAQAKPNGPLFPPFTIFQLSCSVDHSKPALHITNSNRVARTTLKAGSRIVWNGSQGQQGEFKLPSDLPLSKSIDVNINSDFPTCKAAFVQ